MTPSQQTIIKGLRENSFFLINGENEHVTTLQAIKGAAPDMSDDEIHLALTNWEGVERTGSGLEGQIKIPGKYFL